MGTARGKVWSEAPPSVLTDISPARGEIARVPAFPTSCTGASKCESGDTSISPLAGEMPTGRGGRLAPNFPRRFTRAESS
jgi:hypothetical protein